MLAAFVSAPSPDDPLSVLEVGERPEPEAPEGWTTVTVEAAALNQHDLFSLRGVGLPAERMPMVLGCDAAGTDADGNEVVVHAVVSSPGWTGDETMDPKRSLLSERYQGTLAEQVVVPARNVVPKPPQLSYAEAACLPTAWLTAYRMLFVRSGLQPGQTVLVQGASGGVATALVQLGTAAGYRMWVTGRSEEKRAAALALGAEQAFEPGARLPERVDGVMESVGKATWAHSIRSLRPGGVVVTCGATTGFDPSAELNRVFFTQLSVVGSTMGTREELQQLMRMLEVTGVRPQIDVELPLREAREGFARMFEGRTNGKIVFVG
jgi:NADPH:quinone reductase-like Zn-dependent oxidoreductase